MELLTGATNFFLSFFQGTTWQGVLLAIAFGAFWLAGYWPPLFRRYWLWAVAAASAFLTLAAAAYVQIPAQWGVGMLLNRAYDQATLVEWILLAGIPQTLLSGLVQEGAKLVPILIFMRLNRSISGPKLGLMVGAVAGCAFGVFEAQWAHNQIINAGWNPEIIGAIGFNAVFGFWERFAAVALHTGLSALAGWGLARGWGWQFWLIAGFLHSLTNYGVVLLQMGLLSPLTLEIYASAIALVLVGVTLWLRWRRDEDAAISEAPDAAGSSAA